MKSITVFCAASSGVHEIYEKQMAYKSEHGTIELHRNQPPIAGSLEWLEN